MSTQSITTVIIGAGHSGLAMSYRLTQRGIDHVVLERGRVAESWRSGRWDSLRLLTPNWQAGLPGYEYAGDDPDGFFTMPELIDHITGYADAVGAPVQTETTVTRLSGTDDGYRVETDQGTWLTQSVVLANGANAQANIPPAAESAPDHVTQLTPLDYRSPEGLEADGGVLVVGASATGAQLADELARSGRRVVLSSGELVRMPRTYRGRDIFWWMHHAGVLDERWDEMTDILRARHIPSPQLIGSTDGRDLNLDTLQANGVEVVGKLGMIRDDTALFSGGLNNIVQLSDLKQERLLDRFDEWADENHVEADAPHRPEPVTVAEQPRLQLDLRREGISTILWATGFRPDYSWLDLPVLDYKGQIVHDGGVVEKAPGVYVLGTSVLRRRRSTYINGAAADTADLAAHLAAHLDAHANRVGSLSA